MGGLPNVSYDQPVSGWKLEEGSPYQQMDEFSNERMHMFLLNEHGHLGRPRGAFIVLLMFLLHIGP